MTPSIEHPVLNDKAAWRKLITPYQQPDLRKSLWQVGNTIIPYILLWVLMVPALRISYWLALPLILIGAGLSMRSFIIFHDCGHGSFFTNRRANEIVGFITGLITFTPYHSWRHGHALHHASSGDLDRRGAGDVPMMTVNEYLAATPMQRLGYRFLRNPLILFGIGPIFLFLVLERIPNHGREREHRSVMLTNVTLLLIAILLSLLIGWQQYLVLQLSILFVASTAGVWLFYVQHQYEGVYWKRHEEWDYATAAVEGSSFYKLPKLLQWFTGSIGYHHIHHLSPRIPNYNLQRCHDENPELQVDPIHFWESLRCMRYRLWDEDNYRLISFGEFRQMQRTNQLKREATASS